ncbi:MAG: YfhO family protein [Acidobacteria bacterium]|nr:YfhO family protein [Acidobacteriota bacterium]
MATWIPCGNGFISADVIGWKEGVFARRGRRSARAVKTGDGLVIAEVSATGLLVLSEVYHPGWIATINGHPARIYQVNNTLRGLVVSPGRNHIVMQYCPASIRLGAILSALAFFGTFLFAALVSFTQRRRPPLRSS